MSSKKGKNGKRPIFRAWITSHGVRIYAKDYGLKAFKLWI
jgi:hypothetical protein